MSYTSDKAVGSRSADPLETVLNPTAPQKGSNQTQFVKPDVKAVPDGKPSGNQQQFGANTKGTGKENVATNIALAGKRKLAVKMPANF